MNIFTYVGYYFTSHLAYQQPFCSFSVSTSLHPVLVRQFHFIDHGKHDVEQVRTTVCHNVERIWKCSAFAEHFARKQNTTVDFIAYTVTLSTCAKGFCSVCRNDQTKDLHLHQHFCENFNSCLYEIVCSAYIRTRDCSQTFLSDICSSTEYRLLLKRNNSNAVLNCG